MAASVAAIEPFVTDTPASAMQCQTTVMTWTGGVRNAFQLGPNGPLPWDASCLFTDDTDCAATHSQSIVHDRTSERHLSLTDGTFSWNTDLPASDHASFLLLSPPSVHGTYERRGLPQTPSSSSS
ncbi:uncharacterized protein TRAVEDRAFT_53501 [Trametes versicolor FP-101664 SS1]|uniref:uncharacterized protein n=1 Tax=Trametes versicolor (strain FP-101664) TaxID=717944 RepID=UPI0004621D69|nr:uncharacterized protein TRAVEDRAFT_53501 [Trametes versicolor FP-101664 SS1]EIW53086.1 hypothetical protein TRAVEDRAFT_53501 [Trametes versicolor FP-101664 SS1]